jgi:hypothetical protein
MVLLSGISFDLGPGNFVLASVPQYDNRSIVCEIISISSQDALTVYCCLEDDLLVSLLMEDPRQSL